MFSRKAKYRFRTRLSGRQARAPGVAAIVKGNIETPNDISGVVYITPDEQNNWKEELKTEIRSVGFQV